MKDNFSTFRPIIHVTYFCAVILLGLLSLHPLFLFISVVASFTYSVKLSGLSAAKFNTLLLIITMILVIPAGFLINSRGKATFGHIFGQPLTGESLLMSITIVFCITAIIMWISCYHQVMAQDGWIRLLGNRASRLAAWCFTTLRMIPRLKAQIQMIAEGQRCIGQGMDGQNLSQRISRSRNILRVAYAQNRYHGRTVKKALYSKGYGTGKRSNYFAGHDLYRDIGLLFLLVLFIVAMAAMMVFNDSYFMYFSDLGAYQGKSADTVIAVVVLLALSVIFCFLPLIIDKIHEMRQKKTYDRYDK